jgi:predicted phage-related endonuclease
VAETAMNDKGWNLIEPKGTLVDVEFPFLIGHPDRFIEGVQELVEIKTRGNYAMSEYGEQGTDEIMKSDYVQVQFYLMLTGFKRGWLTALMLGEIAEGLCYFPVDRNDEFIALMREECVNFWKNHVLKRIPPSLATYEQASRIYRKSIAGSIVQCNDEIFKAYEKSMKYNETLKSTKLLLDSEKARIAMFMADHEVLTMNNDKPLVTFKAGSRTDFDSKKFEKEQPDLYKQYLRTSPTKTMLFKEIK